MNFWIINTLNGLSLAMILFLLAAGLTLIFGLMRIINMAHGSFYLLGGYIAISTIRLTGDFGTGALLAVIAVAVIGVAVQRLFLARLYKQEMPQALLTLGLLFIVADFAFFTWGGDPLLVPEPKLLQGGVHFFGVVYPLYRLFLIGWGLATALFLWAFLERTKIGAVVRAGMDDEEMVRGLGINMPLVFTAIFALGAALAAIGGVLGGPLLGMFPGADFEVALLAFVVVTVGGLGSIRGAFLGSLLVGLVDNFGNVWFPQLSLFTIFVPMVIVLALRPTGLMGRA
ncbi:MAG TPA: branched-chain amino acid ABC transporter permease [Stellaceae bacterium]|nr:branched-chain amino acid ABC transporter permease [Stellaceae bacterium]